MSDMDLGGSWRCPLATVLTDKQRAEYTAMIAAARATALPLLEKARQLAEERARIIEVVSGYGRLALGLLVTLGRTYAEAEREVRSWQT